MNPDFADKNLEANNTQATGDSKDQSHPASHNEAAPHQSTEQSSIKTPPFIGREVTFNVDFTVFMFCYPWRGPRDPYPDSRYARQPQPRNANQADPNYGRWSFQTAGENGVDVMVGFWILRNGRVPPVYENFINSISWYTGVYNGPKIALSMEFDDAQNMLVGQQVGTVRSEMQKPRYFQFRDRKNQLRLPAFNWGVRAFFKDPGLVSPDIEKIKAVGQMLAALRQPVGGAIPFIIWDTSLLYTYDSLVNRGNPAASAIQQHVFSYIDGFYQHSCYIPTVSVPSSSITPGYDWSQFPSYSLDDKPPGSPISVLDITVQSVRDQKAMIGRHNLRAPADGDGMMRIIPGTFPQYSRERQSYSEYVQNHAPASIMQSRVKCTSIEQWRKLLRALRDEAPTANYTRVSISQINIQRLFALTSWNEWPEGTTFEPCQPDANDPMKFGISDSRGDFLKEVKAVLDKYSYTVVGEENINRNL
jgi:hypothetical protein